VSIASGKGHYKLPVHLAPGASATIDMADLIADAKPDPDGNLIPPGTSAGGMIVSGPSDLLDDIDVVLSGGVFSVFGATCVPVCYSCGPSIAAFQVAPAPIQSTVGGTTQMTATVTTSGGVKTTETGNTKWSSQSASIASVASGGMVTAVAGGTTTIDGVIQWADEASTCYPIACTSLAYEGEAPTTVLVPTMVEPIATTSQGAAACTNKNQQGWVRYVTNQLQYQNGTGVLQAGISMTDTISISSPNGLGISGAITGTASTNGNGSWPDTYFVCTLTCPSSGSASALQSWTWNGVGLPHVNLVVYKCTSITVDGF
ncbi:MAG: Ig-like domain-containing protein, partial [Candidatus Acidiferrales bacterium]